MCKKLGFIVLITLVLAMVANVQAAISWTDASGADHDWVNPDNWSSSSVPTSADDVWWDYYSPLTPAYIKAGDNAVCNKIMTRQLMNGVSDVNILIMTGGTLNTNQLGYFGSGASQSDPTVTGVAILQFNGGTVNVNQDIDYSYTGGGVKIVSGADVNVGGGFNMSYGPYKKSLEVTGGVFDLKGYFADAGQVADNITVSGGKLRMGSSVQLGQNNWAGQGPITWKVTGSGDVNIPNSWLRHYYGAVTFTLDANAIMRVKGDIETCTRPSTSAIWNISGNAHLIAGSNFYPVEDISTAVINMSGGTMDVVGEIGVGWGGGGEQVTWNLTGGKINCDTMFTAAGNNLMDINGGRVNVAGNEYSSLRTSFGLTHKAVSSAGQLIVTYDEANDVTVLTSGPTHGQAYWPLPGDGQIGQSILSKLQWIAGNAAASNGHHVYLGTSPGTLADKGTVTDPNFDPGELLPSTTYYWRVDEINGGTTTGDVWSFTTGAASCDAPPLYDLNNDCKVNFKDFALLAGEWLNCGLIPVSACGM